MVPPTNTIHHYTQMDGFMYRYVAREGGRRIASGNQARGLRGNFRNGTRLSKLYYFMIFLIFPVRQYNILVCTYEVYMYIRTAAGSMDPNNVYTHHELEKAIFHHVQIPTQVHSIRSINASVMYTSNDLCFPVLLTLLALYARMGLHNTQVLGLYNSKGSLKWVSTF